MKKILSIFITAALLLSTFGCMTAFAAAPTLTVSSATAKPGETVDVTISFDTDALTVDKENVEISDSVGGDYEYASKFAWDKNKNVTYSGVFFTLPFTVNENAPAGDYSITLTYKKGDISNKAEEDVDFTVVNGKITVTSNKSKIIIGGGETADALDISEGDALPVDQRVGTKFVLGWVDADGQPVTVFDPEVPVFPVYVETMMLKVKFQFGQQTDTSVSMRCIASVDNLDDYSTTGWVFSLKNSEPTIGGANVSARESTKVATGIYASGKRLDVKDIYATSAYIDSSNYIYTFDIKNIPQSAAASPIYVRAYVKMNDGTVVYGDVKAIRIADYVTF